MKSVADMPDIEELKTLAEMGQLDGALNNSCLMHPSGRCIHEVTAENFDLVDLPISAEVTAIRRETPEL